MRSPPECMPDIDTIKYWNVTDIELTLKENSGLAVTLIAARFEYEIYREIQVFLTRFNVTESINSVYPPMIISANLMATISVIDSTFYNCSSSYALVWLDTWKRVNFHNIYVEQVDSLNQFTFITQRSQHVDVQNITLNNSVFTGTGTDAIFYFSMRDGGQVTLDGLYVQNSKLGYRDTLHFLPKGAGSLSISNAHFDNVTINVAASLIKSGTTNHLEIKNCHFDKVKQANPSDNTNVMINLGTLYLDSNSEFIMQNVVATESSVSLLKLGSLTNAGGNEKSIKISNISYTNSIFEFSQDLIVLGNIEFEDEFEMIFTQLSMQNLTFLRTGNLLRLQQQIETPVKLTNSFFTDIYGGSIYLESANLQNTELKTKVTLISITAEFIDGGTGSFIHTNEGVELTISDSKFRFITSEEGGAVINADYQNSFTSFHNTTFQNNTALYGGVAIAQYGSVINF